jgi:hypothetical protein
MSSGVMARGTKALMSSAAGTRIDLVEQRPLGDRPDHGQLAVRAHAGDLLGVEREVVADHAGRLAGGHAREQGDVVEQRRDVVDEGEEPGGGIGS